jgi:diaminopimelate epimerase
MAVQNSDRFPDGVNVEFIEVAGRNEIRMRVWERGSGETLACGTGAAASAAAGCMTGRLDSPVLVHLAGGDLTIDYESDTGRCFMTGTAEEVYSGEYDV